MAWPVLRFGVQPFIWSAVLAVLALPARADVIIQADSLDFSAGGVAVPTFQEFDPALGTLDTVSVQIDSTLQFQVQLGPLESVAPIVDLDAFGAGGKGFGLSSTGARFFFPAHTNGSDTSAEVANFFTGFSLGFTLTALTDLTGVIVPSTSATVASLVPPATVEAQREDFIEGIVAIGIAETLALSPVNFSPLAGFTAGGSMVLTYNYTPFGATVDAAEPASLALFVAGLGLMGRLVRRRQKIARASA